MLILDDTICAVSTPPGVGGLAVARVSGPQAIAICDRIWSAQKRLADAPSHACRVGTVLDSRGEALDQAVAAVFRAPHSFTGQDTVEISVHGSQWVQQELITSLMHAGARLADSGEFTRRAFASGRIDLTQAEGIADVIASTSRAAQRIALNQMRGHFSERLKQLRETLLELASMLELELDFSEEDVSFASRDKLIELASEVRDTTGRLASGFATGEAIRNGIPVAIIGATNAGKSSLLNALTQDDRAIVSDIHGTTRDVVEDSITLGDYRLRLMDTAGIRPTDDPIESLGIERSQRALNAASVVLLVIDTTDRLGSAPIEQVRETMAQKPNVRLIVALNKVDISQVDALPDFADLRPDAVINISTTEGTGIEELRKAIHTSITELTASNAAGDTIVTNARHYAALLDANQAADRALRALHANLPADLIAEDIRQCITALGTITGTITTPEILTAIFSRFCIGK